MATPTTVQVKMQLRFDTAANWTSVNPTLLNGEMGLETTTNKIKIGDGTTAWNSLGYFPFVVSGGTVTGNLEIGSTGTLTFEGSSANDFETTLGVVDPTADRTITLPDQSGTVVVTGNASIVDADIAAGAEIAVSKLANGAANQVIVTDGTNVSWSDDLTLAGNLTVNGTTTTINTETLVVEDKNIELGVVDTPSDTTADGGGITLKGTTDKTINWLDATDSWTSSEHIELASGKSYRINGAEVLSATTLGSGVTSSSLTSVGTLGSVTVTGDATAGTFIPTSGTAPSNGLYLPATNSVALSTNGTGRLFVDSNGNVGVGITPTTRFHVYQTGSTQAGLVETNQSASVINFKSTGQSSGQPQVGCAASDMILNTNGTERLRITSAGLVGIGTSAPSYQFHVSNTGASALGVFTRTSGASCYIEGGSITGTVGTVGNHNLGFTTNSTTAMTIDTSQRVGIGTSTPRALLDVGGSSVFNAGTYQSPALAVSNGYIAIKSDAADGASRLTLIGDSATGDGTIDWGGTGNFNLKFTNNGSERARIDSSGRLLVGTSSARTNYFNLPSTFAPRVQIESAGTSTYANLSITNNVGSESYGGGLILAKSRGGAVGSNTILLSDDEIGSITFQGNDGSDFVQTASITVHVDGTPGANDMPGRLVFSTTADGASSPTERMRISSDGKIASSLAGTTNEPNLTLNVGGIGDPANSSWITPRIDFVGSSLASPGTTFIGATGGLGGRSLVFATGADAAGTERMRISSNGTVLMQKTATGMANEGLEFIWGLGLGVTNNQNPVLRVNRLGTDGTLVSFQQDTVEEGTISVSGTTVSYNGAHLSRWSQLPSGAERTEILRGSVLSNIDEMCEWGEEDNEQLNRMKVSDVEGDKNVSGVFQAWDDDDDTYTNDFYCAMTGDFIIRIGAGVTIERGDLLMSAGDGTAKPQDDDIIRSKTIAKVTSTTVSCTYDDGSYCVPCVLMAC